MPLDQARTLDAHDFEDFARLTEQESHSIEGQIAKMTMIEQMIRRRHEAEEDKVRDNLSAAYQGAALEEQVEKRCQPIHIFRMPLGDGRFNLIVEKGVEEDSFDPEANIFRVMIPAHIDTVNSAAPLKLTRQTGSLYGKGAYDMGAAVLNNIALAASLEVPEGMRVYIVFTVDEEEDSRGIRHLIKEWEVFPHISAVISSEIGPVEPCLEGQERCLSLIRSRAGRAKFACHITIDPDHFGHGARRGKANATKAKRLMQNRLYDRFEQGFEGEPPAAVLHPLFGSDAIEELEDASRKTQAGYGNPDQSEFKFNIKLVPTPEASSSPRVQSIGHDLKHWASGIAKREQWKAHHINHTLVPNDDESSYEPFEVPADHPQVLLLKTMIERVTGMQPLDQFGESTADECDMAEALFKARGAEAAVLTVPPRGDGAHGPREHVEEASILETRQVIRLLIEDPEGYLSLRKS